MTSRICCLFFLGWGCAFVSQLGVSVSSLRWCLGVGLFALLFLFLLLVPLEFDCNNFSSLLRVEYVLCSNGLSGRLVGGFGFCLGTCFGNDTDFVSVDFILVSGFKRLSLFEYLFVRYVGL